MGAHPHSRTSYTLDEYIAFENGADARHEYYQDEFRAILDAVKSEGKITL